MPMPLARALLARAAASAAAAVGVASSIAQCANAPSSSSVPTTVEVNSNASQAQKDSGVRIFDSFQDSIYNFFIKPYAEPSREHLLPDIPMHIRGKEKPTLVVSLDGTLIESTWNRQYGWRYIKRPGVDQFLASLANHYELVLWTESMNTADPIVERLDQRRLFRHRLYRDTTTYTGGKHIKDLSALNRDLNKVLIIDCEEECFSLHPKHGIAVPKYKSDTDPDKADAELIKLIPLLQYVALSFAASKGRTNLSEELERYRGQGDMVEAFQRHIEQMKARGKLPHSATNSPASSGHTLWERLRGSRDRS